MVKLLCSYLDLHSGGGVVCTRVLTSPGGKLLINADANANDGKITVRVSDPQRKVIAGFDHADTIPFHGNATAAEIAWREKSIDELKEKPVRLEFFIQSCDLYSFCASPINSP